MTRIISGQWGGRRLQAPKGSTTRPTTDRVREAVFSSLQSHFGSLADLRVLDLFSGTGALAFEALSRGAVSADLVEEDPKASATLRANVQTLQAGDRALIHRVAASRFVRDNSSTEPRWDVIFLDPPYDFSDEDLASLVADLRPMLAADGLFVVERSGRSNFSWPQHVETVRTKSYGETQIWYGQ